MATSRPAVRRFAGLALGALLGRSWSHRGGVAGSRGSACAVVQDAALLVHAHSVVKHKLYMQRVAVGRFDVDVMLSPGMRNILD